MIAIVLADLARVGILYEEDGELGDFHALRHTFITDLVDSEAAPKDAQALAYHSSIVLTVDRYYRPGIQGHRSAIERLGQTRRDAKRKRLDISRESTPKFCPAARPFRSIPYGASVYISTETDL